MTYAVPDRASSVGEDSNHLASGFNGSASACPAGRIESTNYCIPTQRSTRRRAEYYQYTQLDVFRRFIGEHTQEPLISAIDALRVTVSALQAVEHSHAEFHAVLPAALVERRLRLQTLVAAINRMSRLVSAPTDSESERIDDAIGDSDQWRSFVLAISTGTPRSREHNEHLFLRAVQACEVVFFLVRWLAMKTLESVNTESVAVCRLKQAVACADILNDIFSVLATMTPREFLRFRKETGDASAVQSMNYHAMEIVVYGFDPRRAGVFEGWDHLHLFNRSPFRDHESLRESIERTGGAETKRQYAQLDRCLSRWRGSHYGFAVRYLPKEATGSGGTEGASYVKKFVRKVSCDEATTRDLAQQVKWDFLVPSSGQPSEKLK